VAEKPTVTQVTGDITASLMVLQVFCMSFLHELSVRGSGENFHFTALVKPSIVPV
jgi:hypothetical protein